MTSTDWISDADGNWSTGSNWSEGVKPVSGDDVTIDTDDSSTITHSAGIDTVSTLTVGNDDFAVSGGTLTVSNGASFANGLSVSGSGALVLGASSSNLVSGVLTNTGAISLGTASKLDLEGGGSIGAGSFSLATGAVLEFGDLVFALRAGALATNAGTILVEDGVLSIGADQVSTLSGNVQFGGDDFSAFLSGPGTIETTGSVQVTNEPEAVKLLNGVIWSNAGTVSDAGEIDFDPDGNDNTTLVNQAGATFNLTSDAAQIFARNAGGDIFENAGTLAKTGGAGTSTISVAIANTGTIVSSSGTLELSGDGVLGGTIGGGNGKVALDGIYSADKGVTQSVKFASGAQFGDGDEAAFLSGPGTIETSGTVLIAQASGFGAVKLVNNVTWSNLGTVNDAGEVNFDPDGNDDTTLINQVGATFNLTDDAAQIYAQSAGTDVFENAGTLAKTGGIGTSTISVAITNTGTIKSTSGILELAGGGTLGGTIGGGTGKVALDGVFTAGDGVTTSVTFASGVQFGNGDNAAFLSGPGTIETKGAVLIAQASGFGAVKLVNGVTWSNRGTVSDAGEVNLDPDGNDNTTLINQAGASFNLTDDAAQIYAENAGADVFKNAGTLAKTGGTGTSTVSVTVTDTGTINASSGTLEFAGGGSFAGNIGGSTAVLLSADATFSGLAIGGTVTVTNGDDSTIDQTGTVTIGDSSVKAAHFVNAGTYNIAAGQNIGRGSAAGSLFQNSGLFDTADDGAGSIAVDFTNTGTVDVAGGTLTLSGPSNSFGGAVDGTGTLAFSGGSSTFNAVDLEVDNLTLSGNSTITAATSMGYGGRLTTASGTTLAVGAKTVTLSGAGSALAGTVTGTGTLAFSGGSQALNTGAKLSVSKWSVNGGARATLNAALTYAGSFSLQSNARVTLSGKALTLGGPASFGSASILGSSTLTTNGASTIGANDAGALTIGGSVTWQNNGVATASADLTEGSTASIAVAVSNGAAGTYKIINDSGIQLHGAATSVFANAGLLEKTGGILSQIAVNVTSQGTITVAAGTLEFDGQTNSFAGAVSGKGTLAFGDGDTTLANGLKLTVARISMSLDDTQLTLGGNLSYAGAFSAADGTTVDVGAKTLTLTEATTLAGAINGAGTLAFAGGTQALDDGVDLSVSNWVVSGAAVTTLNTALSYSKTFKLSAAKVTLNGVNLNLSGSSTFSGTIAGTGTLAFTGGSQLLNSGSSLSVANWSVSKGSQTTIDTALTYSKIFTVQSKSKVTLNGNTLALTGAVSLNAASIVGSSTLTTSGATKIGAGGVTLGGSVTWQNNGTVTASGNLTQGDGASSKASLIIGPKGIYDITSDAGILQGGSKASVLTNSGVLEKTGGSQTSVIAVALVNNKKVTVSSGELDLGGAVSGTGTLNIAEGATLELESVVGAQQTVALGFAGGQLLLDDTADFHASISGFGADDAIDLTAFRFRASEKLSFAENAAKTKGVVTITDGTLKTSITLFGQYVASGFHVVTDGGTGTAITYGGTPNQPQFEIAGNQAAHH
jgi:fibronectin-binding autotransporter adhesin